MHNKRLFCLLCVEKLAPDHIKSSHQAVASGSKFCYSKLSPVVVILGSRQSSLYNQDLNFQFNFKSKFGKPTPEKDDSSPKFKRITSRAHFGTTPCRYIIRVYYTSFFSSNETFMYYIRGRKCCLKNVKFQLSWKHLGNLTDERLSHLFYQKKIKFESIFKVS